MWLKIAQEKNSTIEKDCINIYQCHTFDEEWHTHHDTTFLTYVDKTDDNEQVLTIELNPKDILKIDQLKTPSAHPQIDDSMARQLRKYFNSIFHPLHPFTFIYDKELDLDVAKVKDVFNISDEDVENALAERFKEEMGKTSIYNNLDFIVAFKDSNGYIRIYLVNATCKRDGEGHTYNPCVEKVTVKTTMKDEFFSKEALERLTIKINENEN